MEVPRKAPTIPGRWLYATSPWFSRAPVRVCMGRASRLLAGVSLLAAGCAGSGHDATEGGSTPALRAPTAAVAARAALPPERPRELPRRLGGSEAMLPELERAQVSLVLDAAPLDVALRELAVQLGVELVLDRSALGDLLVTVHLEEICFGDLLDHFEQMFPVRFHRRGRTLRVEARQGPRLALLLYPLTWGLISADLPDEFASLRQLSIISRSQREDATLDVASEAAPPEEEPASHLEVFLADLPRLVPWPEGSAWHLDRRRNLLLIRGTPEALDQAEACLEMLSRPAAVVEIEARFVEVSEGRAHDWGVELGLGADFPLDLSDGEAQSVIGEESGTRFGTPPVVPGDPSGLQLSVLGILTQPRFEVLLRALRTDEDAEVLAAPAIATVNNSRATIAITRNLPFVEDYRPYFDRNLVSQDGITSSQSSVALVASINDRNFTGIVLKVTPSVGTERDTIHLRIQPVVRDQVDSIVISNGALVEGVATPAIARPIIETRLIDTQLALPAGGTLVLGGLKTTNNRRIVRKLPILGSIPLLGRLFRREVEEQRRRDLIILVTARLAPP